MRFFKNQASSSAQPQVQGLVAYYGLADWWLSAFTQQERSEIESAWGHIEFKGQTISVGAPLTRGHIGSNPLNVVEFLLVLGKRFAGKSTNGMHARIHSSIMQKARELAGRDLPGYVNGEHYNIVMERANDLIRDGKVVDADSLVDAAFSAFEAESRIGMSLTQPDAMPPAKYRDFAILYRQRKDYAREVAILERYMRLPHAPGKMPGELAERLHKARELLRNGAITS